MDLFACLTPLCKFRVSFNSESIQSFDLGVSSCSPGSLTKFPKNTPDHFVSIVEVVWCAVSKKLVRCHRTSAVLAC